MDHTVLPANNTMPAFPSWRSPDVTPQQLRQQTSNCSSLLIYRPRKNERLSWPSWLTYSGWLTHISGHPSATSRAQDSESTSAKGQCGCATGIRISFWGYKLETCGNDFLHSHSLPFPCNQFPFLPVPIHSSVTIPIAIPMQWTEIL